MQENPSFSLGHSAKHTICDDVTTFDQTRKWDTRSRSKTACTRNRHVKKYQSPTCVKVVSSITMEERDLGLSELEPNNQIFSIAGRCKKTSEISSDVEHNTTL